MRSYRRRKFIRRRRFSVRPRRLRRVTRTRRLGKSHAKIAKRMVNPKSRSGKLLRSCIARCSHPNIPLRYQIIGQGQSSATALPISPLSTNTHYTINLTENLARTVNSIAFVPLSATAQYAPGIRPQAFVHNMQIKITIWNAPTGTSNGYTNDLEGRIFEYYLANTNQDYSVADKNGNFRAQWGTKDPVTGTVISPGISNIYDGNQIGASGAYIGDWVYLSRAPFNKDVIKFCKVKRFRIPGGRLSTSTTVAGVRHINLLFDWKLEKVVKVENQLTFDGVSTFTDTDQKGDDVKVSLLTDNAAGQQNIRYTKYMTVVIDDPATGWTAGVPTITSVAQMNGEILVNARVMT